MSLFCATFSARLRFLFFGTFSPFAGRPAGKRLLPLMTPSLRRLIDVGCILILFPWHIPLPLVCEPAVLRKVSQPLRVLTSFSRLVILFKIAAEVANFSWHLRWAWKLSKWIKNELLYSWNHILLDYLLKEVLTLS